MHPSWDDHPSEVVPAEPPAGELEDLAKAQSDWTGEWSTKPAGEDWAHEVTMDWMAQTGEDGYTVSDAQHLANLIRTAAEREIRERERKARLDAIEECCKTICVYCSEGKESVLHREVWMHRNPDGSLGHCYAHAIRALSTSAPTQSGSGR